MRGDERHAEVSANEEQVVRASVSDDIVAQRARELGDEPRRATIEAPGRRPEASSVVRAENQRVRDFGVHLHLEQRRAQSLQGCSEHRAVIRIDVHLQENGLSWRLGLTQERRNVVRRNRARLGAHRGRQVVAQLPSLRHVEFDRKALEAVGVQGPHRVPFLAISGAEVHRVAVLQQPNRFQGTGEHHRLEVENMVSALQDAPCDADGLSPPGAFPRALATRQERVREVLVPPTLDVAHGVQRRRAASLRGEGPLPTQAGRIRCAARKEPRHAEHTISGCGRTPCASASRGGA
mmetsp:Transcript_58383/g.162744  ORF Transcript_58383/g.162744 Transcript_58383/m.162744 type:complete len:293 (-) Transcript_58383:1-879(-)